jgi:hypothetical protein
MSETKLFCTIPLETARLIDKVFLPANPNKMRGNDPRVSQAARDFKAAIAAGSESPAPALTPEQAAAGDMREALESIAKGNNDTCAYDPVWCPDCCCPSCKARNALAKVDAALAKAGKP